VNSPAGKWFTKNDAETIFERLEAHGRTWKVYVMAAVGAGIGAGAGAILDHHDKKEIKADVEDVLPPGSSGIVALFEEKWVEEVEKALAKADKVSSHDIDSDSADQVKASATS
jgi:uncharacterized membrane protein